MFNREELKAAERHVSGLENLIQRFVCVSDNVKFQIAYFENPYVKSFKEHIEKLEQEQSDKLLLERLRPGVLAIVNETTKEESKK
jgi:hypothetical protein